MAETKFMREFREAVLTGLGEVKVEVANIVQRLDKLNGSVARHESDLATLKVADAKHEGVISQVAAIQADVEKLKAATLTTTTKIDLTEKWAKGVWAAFGGSIILLLQKLPEILKLVEGK